MSEIPQLTSNTIQRMFAGEKVDQPVLQVLGSQIINSFDIKCAGLVLSDGESFNAFYVAPVAYQQQGPNQYLEKYTVLQVEKYVNAVIDSEVGEENTIVVQKLRVLKLGSEIGCTLGYPLGYIPKTESELSGLRLSSPASFVPETESMPSSTPELSTPESHTQEPPSTPEPREPHTPEYCTPTKLQALFKWNTMSEKAQLTSGVIPCIMAGGSVEKPVVQILASKMCRIGDRKSLRLMVTDGKTSCYIYCCAALSQLHEELEKLSVVQLDMYGMKRLKKVGRITVVFAMTGLNRGSDICFQLSLQPHRATLSSGLIWRLTNGAEWLGKSPVVQIVELKNVSNGIKVRTRLLVSDGQRTCIAWLGSHLTRLHRALTNLSIVRLNNYNTNHMSERNKILSITIYELSVLNLGCDAGFEWNIMRHRPATLTPDFINQVYDGDLPQKPVLQIMNVKKVQQKGCSPSLRLVLSDGSTVCNAWLPAEMTDLFDELTKLPVVRLDNYIKKTISCGHFELLVFQMTGLKRAVVRVGRIGYAKVPRQELLKTVFAQPYYVQYLEDLLDIL